MAISKATLAVQKLRDDLAKTINLAVRSDAATVIGKVALRMAQKGIAEAKNPMGRSWRKLKDRSGKLPLRYLQGTLKFRMGFLAFAIVEEKPYAIFHQKGAKRRYTKWKLPARNFLPRGKHVPKPWAEEMLKGFAEYTKRLRVFARQSVSAIIKV